MQVLAEIPKGCEDILTPKAMEFLTELHRRFNPMRLQLLETRKARQAELDRGVLPDFLPQTAAIRAGDWKCAPIPHDLQDRRVEITGPVDRKMIINALNSGAKVFMADFEDASAPTWKQMLQGQVNLRDAVNRTISLRVDGKEYKLKESGLATLMVRPRGWHLNESHVTVDGEEMSGSLFDFGLFFFHNAHTLIAKGSGPYFYLPKMESHLEARLWNNVFKFAQDYMGIKQGTIRATVLIETILAAFEMDEILYELREHSAGLNCGRWDYIFSFIKKFRTHSDKVLPDRAQVTMEAPWMSAYVRLLIQTCHKRGVHAMGGMAAHIPVKSDEKANAIAFEKVRKDKLREVLAGCDGSWVAHPGLISVAMAVFNEHMKTPNQIHFPGDSKPVTAADLLQLGPPGTITRQGLQDNLSVALGYLESWLRGIGCVPINNLMEDAATAEISRSQVWQWIRHRAVFTGTNTVITKELVAAALEAEVNGIEARLGKQEFAKRQYLLAARILARLILSDELEDFLTSAAYPYITSKSSRRARL